MHVMHNMPEIRAMSKPLRRPEDAPHALLLDGTGDTPNIY